MKVLVLVDFILWDRHRTDCLGKKTNEDAERAREWESWRVGELEEKAL